MADLVTLSAIESGANPRLVDRGDGTFARLNEADQQSWARAASGQYFRATNPSFGSGIAQAIATSWAATTPILVMDNTAGASAPSIYPDYIKLICTAAGATSTSGQMGLIVDTANRYSSGGTSLTPQCVHTGKATASNLAALRFGAVTATAATAPRQLGRDTVKTQAAPCWVVGDEVMIPFGAVDMLAGPTSGAAAAIYPAPTGPVVIAPGHSLLLYLWNPANSGTAPSWEVELGWWEK